MIKLFLFLHEDIWYFCGIHVRDKNYNHQLFDMFDISHESYKKRLESILFKMLSNV